MQKRAAIIPGLDPEVELHGPLPPMAEAAPALRLATLDLRDDRDRFAELANPLIDNFPAKLSGTWYRFNAVACTVRDAIFHNRMLFHDGRPILGLSNIRWEGRAAELSDRGDLQIPEPERRYGGHTAVLVGRSSFNYYHFIADVLTFLEEIAPLVGPLGIERILIDPCRGDPDSFQRQLLDRIHPTLSPIIAFTDHAFAAERLTFVCLWPGVFGHGEGGQPVVKQGPRGIARRAFRASDKNMYDRAEAELGSRPFQDRRDVVVISRRDAIRRRVVNEDALLEALAPFGARPVVMEKLSVAEQMETMANARLVIGPHGAGMINTAFCQAGATAIELTGRHYLQRSFDFATVGIVRHMNYQFLVADEEGDIVDMKGNEGNDIRLSDAAIGYLVKAAAASLSAEDPRAALAATHALASETAAAVAGSRT